jgi:PIN domain nuclease of toxin-antitoxin system
MKLLLDTHLLLWSAGEPHQLSKDAHTLISNKENQLYFSAASLWEITIKQSLGCDDFQVNPRLLYRGLIENDYLELTIESRHAVAIDSLPKIHKDPFDRILVAQATVEAMTLLTADKMIAHYPGSIKLV